MLNKLDQWLSQFNYHQKRTLLYYSIFFFVSSWFFLNIINSDFGIGAFGIVPLLFLYLLPTLPGSIILIFTPIIVDYLSSIFLKTDPTYIFTILVYICIISVSLIFNLYFVVSPRLLKLNKGVETASFFRFFYIIVIAFLLFIYYFLKLG